MEMKKDAQIDRYVFGVLSALLSLGALTTLNALDALQSIYS